MNPEIEIYPVHVRAYSLISQKYNSIFEKVGLGLYHTAVEVHEKEISFGASKGIAIRSISGSDDEGKPIKKNVVEDNGVGAEKEEIKKGLSIEEMEFLGSYRVGETNFTFKEIKHLLSEFSEEEFSKDNYHLINLNCHHFVNAVCKWILIGNTDKQFVPKFVTKASSSLKKIEFLLPKRFLNGQGLGISEYGEGIEKKKKRKQINNNK